MPAYMKKKTAELSARYLSSVQDFRACYKKSRLKMRDKYFLTSFANLRD